MYAPETETAEGVGNMTLILTFGQSQPVKLSGQDAWKMDILASNFQDI